MRQSYTLCVCVCVCVCVCPFTLYDLCGQNNGTKGYFQEPLSFLYLYIECLRVCVHTQSPHLRFNGYWTCAPVSFSFLKVCYFCLLTLESQIQPSTTAVRGLPHLFFTQSRPHVLTRSSLSFHALDLFIHFPSLWCWTVCYLIFIWCEWHDVSAYVPAQLRITSTVSGIETHRALPCLLTHTSFTLHETQVPIWMVKLL